MNCFPTQEQLLLLKAALLPKEKALPAWEKYTKLVDLQKTDHVSTTQFPLVYNNLKQSETPALVTCKSKYRHTWSYNQLHLAKAKQVQNQLHALSIPTCFLKGSSLILGYYKDPGLRVIGDVDLLVPRNLAKEAIESLISSGWVIPESELFGSLENLIERMHGVQFKSPDNFIIDLHWSVLSGGGLDPLIANFTPRTQKIDSHTLLCAEDLLLHTFFHGLKYSPVPLIRWVSDATTILKKSPQFDWSYFFAQAKQLRIELIVHMALDFLEWHGFVDLPKMERYIGTKTEWRHLRFSTKKPLKFLFNFQLYWHSHARNSESENPLILLATLPRFVKKVRKLTHFHELPLFFFRAVFAHVKRTFF